MLSLRPGNAQWIGRRPEQQDAFGFAGCDAAGASRPEGVLVVLADGMGGLSHGREASQVAVKTLLASHAAQPADLPATEALAVALHAANRAVHALACVNEGEGEVGTTLIAAAVRDGGLSWIGVGDSRLYLYRASDDSLTPCNEAHTLENQLWATVADGHLTREAVAAHPDRDALTSFLGLEEVPLVDANLRPLTLQAGDRLLLCSDGVDGVLTRDELKHPLQGDPQRAAESLIALLRARALERQDNATVAVLACEANGGVIEAGDVISAPRRWSGAVVRASAWTAILALSIGAALWFAWPWWLNRAQQMDQTPPGISASPPPVDISETASPGETADAPNAGSALPVPIPATGDARPDPSESTGSKVLPNPAPEAK